MTQSTKLGLSNGGRDGGREEGRWANRERSICCNFMIQIRGTRKPSVGVFPPVPYALLTGKRTFKYGQAYGRPDWWWWATGAHLLPSVTPDPALGIPSPVPMVVQGPLPAGPQSLVVRLRRRRCLPPRSSCSPPSARVPCLPSACLSARGVACMRR